MNKTGQLILLVGVSASGKSTFAKEVWEKDPKNTVVLSRDNMRQLMFGYTESNLHEYYDRKDIVGREKDISNNLDELIRFNLGRFKTVLLDATHLKLSYIESFNKFNVPTTLVVFKTDVSTCIQRDSLRVKSVGQEVIKKQHRRFKNLCEQLQVDIKDSAIEVIKSYDFKSNLFRYRPHPDLADCVVVDIDGTVAEKGFRSPYDMENVDKDTEKVAITNVVRALKEANYPIVICTGRDGTGAEKSKQWLKDNDIPFDRFYIRKAGDMRPDFVVKEEMWREIIKEFNIMLMVDDRRQVIDHSRSLGFTVMDVANHTF